MAIKYVSTTSGHDTDNNGDSPGAAYKTIERAVDQISSGTDVDNKNTIVVSTGIYAEGPIDGSAKDFISLTTAGDGLVRIMHAGGVSGGTYTIKVGDNWDITGNGLDLAVFTKQSHGASVSTSANAYAVFHAGSNNPFTASSVAFVGQKYLRNDITHKQDSFGDAFYRPAGTASSCIFMHLSKIGGSRSLGKLSIMGSLAFNTGMTSSTGNGVYVPATTSDCINNTFSHCTGGAYLIRFPASKLMNNLFADCVAYGVSVTDSDNYFLDDDAATVLGNAIHNMKLLSAAGDSQLWETSQPANQFSSSVTGLSLIPTGGDFPVGKDPLAVGLVVNGRTYSEGGMAPGATHKNAITHNATFAITASVLPHGGKSPNFDPDGLASNLLDGEGISGRAITATGPSGDLFGNSWPSTTNPPVGCFAKYTLYAKDPGDGNLSTDTTDASYVINYIDEVRKSRFRNIDAPIFSECTKAVTNLRGRQTSYKVTTTKT